MRELNAYLSQHNGQTAVIVGNGPSLNDVPIWWLNKQLTFGSNWCFLHDRWTPDYYVAVDPSVVRLDYFDRINETKYIKFIGDKINTRYGEAVKDAVWINTDGSYGNPGFCLDPELTDFWEGWSVTFVALNLAYLMGFTTVLLVGVDHRYEEGQNNHFHPDYEKGTVWKTHDMTRALDAYNLAKRAYESADRKIINLTPGSALPTFKSGKLEDWL